MNVTKEFQIFVFGNHAMALIWNSMEHTTWL